MNMYRIVQVTDLEDHKASQAVAVLIEAFKEDVITNALIGGRQELRQLTMEACVRAGIAGGKLYVALNENDEVVGTAIWYPPGSDFLSDEKQQQEGAGELLAALQKLDPPLYLWWINTLVPSNTTMSNKYLGESFKVKNWSLYSLSVAPEYQRKGIGRLLVQVGEDQAADQGLPTCFEAENEKNLGIYKRLGYTEVGHDYVQGPPDTPGFNFYCLVKTPGPRNIGTK